MSFDTDVPSVPEVLESIPFGADDMVMESNIPDPIGRSNTKVTGFEEDVSDMLPLDQQTFVPSYVPQGLGEERTAQDIVPQIKEDDITAEAMSTEQAKYGAGDFGYAQNRSKRATSAIDNEINTNTILARPTKYIVFKFIFKILMSWIYFGNFKVQ